MRRVAITGLGVIAPNGIGKEEFWSNLISGRSGIGRITTFDASKLPVQIAGEVKDFDPAKYISSKRIKHLTKVAQFAIASAKMAVEDAKLEVTDANRERIGVCFGNLYGKPDVFETDYQRYLKKGVKGIHPLTSVNSCPHSLTVYVSNELGLRGITGTIASGCTAGLDAIIWGFSQIRDNKAEVIIAGGAESILYPFMFSAACASGNFSEEKEEPEKACKPYDLNRSGIVLGEGGAAVVLEDLEHALDRGAEIYGEILGFGLSTEEEGITKVDISGESIAKAIKQALAMARLDLSDIDYINAHGNGMRNYDIAETNGFKLVFDDKAYNIPVSSIKPITGQSLSVTGVLQVIASCLILRAGILPPTINYETPDPKCDMDYVPNRARRARVRNILINAQNFGTHTVIILGKALQDAG